MTTVEKLRDKIAKVKSENAALRAELRNQWEYAHSENCTLLFPHPDRTECRWPMPKVLTDALTTEKSS
jgi:hypothetical protein